MAGLKISACFWCLDPLMTDDVLSALKEGKFNVHHSHCKEREQVKKLLIDDPPDLIISDFDLPDHQRMMIEEEMEPYLSEIPLIYLVGEKNIRKAANTLESGVWDFVQKEHLYKLVPSVYSSQKYANLFKQSKEAEHALRESRDRYMAIFNSVHGGILLFDFNSRKITDYNPRLLEIFGVSKEDMESPDLDAYTAADEGYTIDRAREYVKTAAVGDPVSFEWRNITKSGERFWTLNSISVVHIDKIPYILLVTRDITDIKTSQDALGKSEERLNLALAVTNLGMWDWNLVNDEVYYSPIWFSMLGYGPDEWPQKLETWTTLLHPDDRDQSVNNVQAVIKNRDSSYEIEFRLKHKNGSWVWIRSLGKAVSYDADGNTTRLTGTHEDINKRKQDDLVRQVVFDISNAANSIHSLDELYGIIRESLGRVIDTTNCFLALYNEDSDTLTLPFMEDEKDTFTEFPARKTLTSFVIRTGEAQLVDIEREKELTRKGDIEPVGAPCVSWLGVPLKHEGKTIGVLAVQSYTDLIIYTQSDVELLEFTSDQIAMAIDRRRHQDRIRLDQERQRRVFESSPDPMIVVDPGALILDFNSAFLAAFNVEPDLVYGQKIFGFITKNQWRKSIRDFYETWETGYLKNLEYQVVRPDGVTFDAEVSTGAIYTSDGKPESMVLILKNISERKEAERKILEAKYKAEESDKLKTAFLSNMSHEIRTPMNAIVGFSDLLSDDQLSPEERKDFIAQINQGADDLMRLIDDIIDIAKIEAGQVNVHISECFVRELFNELQLMYTQNIKRTGKERVSIRLNWDWPFNELAIYTDPFRLKQILVNLLSNAVKFTDEGEIVLGLEEHPEGVYFYVKDSGIGIREEKQKVIFQRFMQGHETKTRLYGGTGLGLAISKNLSEILGGRIGVNSQSGEGATFWFILPRNEVPLKHEAVLRTPSNNLRLWEDKKILIAEDDHSNYYFLFEALKETGVEILWSKDGEETMKMFREHHDLNLILMDINMPLINGYKCTREIKKERPDLPVIAQTAYAMSGEREVSREAGCDDYLSKPIKVSELLDTMSRYI